MNRSLVLLVDMPRMLRDLIRSYVRERPDIEIVDEVSEQDLPDALTRTRANVVVVATADPGLPQVCQDLIDERASLRIVAVRNHGRTGSVTQLQPKIVELGELTKPLVLHAIASQRGTS